MRLQPGDRIGTVRVEALLGCGGMSEVYRGHDEEQDRPVALKLVSSGRRLSQLARIRFLREAQILFGLDHPNICKAYDLISDATGDVMVLELIEGNNLRQLMKAGALDHAEKLRIAECIASALAAAHDAGIVHRDLKPENVMLTHTGAVKVLDFDLARPVHRTDRLGTEAPPLDDADADCEGEEGTATAVGSIVGTASYMSPEQARGDPLSVASDVYSLGILLHELFTGSSPYVGKLPLRGRLMQVSLGETQPATGIGRDLSRLVEAMKSMEPDARPTTAVTLRRLASMRRRHCRVQLLRAWIGSAWTRLVARIGRPGRDGNHDGDVRVG